METPARLAREEAGDGQYTVVADHGCVVLDGRALYLFSSAQELGASGDGGPALFCAALSSVTIGISLLEEGRPKVLIVPKSRGSCWMCEMAQQASTDALLHTLRHCVGDGNILVLGREKLVGYSAASEASIDEQLDRLLLCPGFQSEMERIDAALSRRTARGESLIL